MRRALRAAWSKIQSLPGCKSRTPTVGLGDSACRDDPRRAIDGVPSPGTGSAVPSPCGISGPDPIPAAEQRTINHEKILVVEDDPVVLKVLESLLQAEGYQFRGAADPHSALHATKTEKPDLMILDLTLFDDYPFNSLRDGFALLHWLRCTANASDVPVIIHTADLSPKVDKIAADSGVQAVFRKGDDLKKLLLSVRRILNREKVEAAAYQDLCVRKAS